MSVEIYNPEALGDRSGLYSVMSRVRGGELLFLCGMTGESDPESPGADDFERQCHEIYRDIGVALASAGAGYANIVQFTTYLVDRADIPRFKSWRKREFPRLFPNKVYPPNVLVVVSALVDDRYRIEVQTVAAL
jgi:enamine deaminase RidA (YjgF/YER057c/UK114 family)